MKLKLLKKKCAILSKWNVKWSELKIPVRIQVYSHHQALSASKGHKTSGNIRLGAPCLQVPISYSLKNAKQTWSEVYLQPSTCSQTVCLSAPSDSHLSQHRVLDDTWWHMMTVLKSMMAVLAIITTVVTTMMMMAIKCHITCHRRGIPRHHQRFPLGCHRESQPESHALGL